MSILDDLARFVCAPPLDALPAGQRANLRHHIADTAIALIAGAHAPDGRGLAAAQQPEQVFEQIANAAAIIRSTEVDDIHLQSCTTPSSIAVPTALLLSDDCNPSAIENAVYAGIETMVRLGLAIDGPSILYRGIWPTCFAAPVSVAATAAHIWHLDEAQTSHALSLALLMASGRTSRFAGSPSGRWIILKGAVLNGLLAAASARAGYKGDPALLEQHWLENAHGIAVDTDILTNTMEVSHAMEGLSMKPFSTARQALAATQALIELLDEGLDARDIETITVRVPTAYQKMISQPVIAGVRGTGYVSAPHQMALAAVSRNNLWDLDRTAIMHDADVQAFAARISVVADPALQSLYPAKWPAEIEVRAAGATISRKVEHVRGDAATPLDDNARKAKTLHLLQPQIGESGASGAWGVARASFDSTEAMQHLKVLCVAAIDGAPLPLPAKGAGSAPFTEPPAQAENK